MFPGLWCFSAAICFKLWMLPLLLHLENLKYNTVAMKQPFDETENNNM